MYDACCNNLYVYVIVNRIRVSINELRVIWDMDSPAPLLQR